jgi:hypothetical protein
MHEQEIIDNAPLPDWTHHNDDIDSDVSCFYSYIKQVETANGQEFYKLGFDGKRKVWKQCVGIYQTTRARKDIERIAELEKKLKAYKCLDGDLIYITKKELLQRDLEQQAKGVYDVRATTGFWNLSTCSLRTHLREYEVILKNQAKELEEGK